MDKYTKHYIKSFKLFPTKIYRKFSKNISKTDFDFDEITKYAQEKFKKVVSTQTIKLSPPNETELSNIIKSRRSIRNFKSTSVKEEAFSSIIQNSIGSITSEIKENLNFPSAGGLFPLEFYFGVFNVDKVGTGIYHYDLKENSLCLIREEKFAIGLKEYLEQNKSIKNSSFALLISLSPDIMTAKYANKALRFSYFEIGHVMQNFMLNAVDSNLSSVAIGGVDDEILNRTLKLDGLIESIEYCCLFGEEEK
jgi:SagB-type dehydrogenase family enzyme